MKEIVFVKKYEISDFSAGTIAEDKATITIDNENSVVNISRIYCTDQTKFIEMNGIKFPMNVWRKVSGSFQLEDFIENYNSLFCSSLELFLDKVQEIKDSSEVCKNSKFTLNEKTSIIIDNQEYDINMEENIEVKKLFNTFILNNIKTKLLHKILQALCEDFETEENIDVTKLMK